MASAAEWKELVSQMGSVNAQLAEVRRGLEEVRSSISHLIEGGSQQFREFRAEANRRMDDCDTDRVNLWKSIAEQRIEHNADVAALRRQADEAEKRADSALLWLRVACTGYGMALIAIAGFLSSVVKGR